MPPFEANNNFGTVTSIGVEALGEPGKRTFRLLVESGAAFAQLWLEKEQLQQLAVYIEEIDQEGPRQGRRGGGRREAEPPYDGGYMRLEFKVGSLSMGHDSDVNSFLFLVHDREAVGQDTPDLCFWVPQEMALKLSKEALEVCAAGRPRCVLCGLAINPEGHMCVRSNGHQSLHP